MLTNKKKYYVETYQVVVKGKLVYAWYISCRNEKFTIDMEKDGTYKIYYADFDYPTVVAVCKSLNKVYQ